MMGLDKGKLSRAEREKKTTRKTTRCLAEPIEHAMLQDLSYMFDQMTLFFTWPILGKYIDKSGKARFVGDKVELKKSQNLACFYLHFLFKHYCISSSEHTKATCVPPPPNHSQLGLRLAEGISWWPGRHYSPAVL